MKKNKKKTTEFALIDWLLFIGINVLYLLLFWFVVCKSKFSNYDSLPIWGVCIFYSICLMIIYHAFFVEGIITLSPKRAFFPEKKRNYFKKNKNKYILIFYVYIIPILLTTTIAILHLYHCSGIATQQR